MRGLLSRNVALILAATLVAELITGILINRLVLIPQTDRIATVMARAISAFSDTMEAVPPAERERLIEKLGQGAAVTIRPASGTPPEGAGWPSFLEIRYMEALARQLRDQKGFEWRSDRNRRLWVKIYLAGEPYWIAPQIPRDFNPLKALLASLAVAFVASGAGAILIQRRIDAPMRRLAEAAAKVGTEGGPERLPETGPREIAEVSRSFNIMTQRLAEVDAERALMLAGISHDLRTPLAKLRLSLAMMPEADEELTAGAARQVDRIDKMIGQFLDFARSSAEEGAVALDLAELAAEVLAASDARGSIDLPPGRRCLIEARPKSLERAVLNLVNNALRHGAEPVEIAIGLDDGEFWIAVRDHGPGIPPQDREQVLRPFVRGDAARGGSGTGLGLAIVSQIVRVHNARLDLTTLPDGRFEARITGLKPATWIGNSSGTV